MKKLLIGLSVVSLMFFAACKNASSPLTVAENFSKAMNTQDFAAAKKNATANSKSILDAVESAAKNTFVSDSMKSLMQTAVFKASNQKAINDSSCSVDITIKYAKTSADKPDETDTFIMKKENGEWKVDLQATVDRLMEQMGNGLLQPQTP